MKNGEKPGKFTIQYLPGGLVLHVLQTEQALMNMTVRIVSPQLSCKEYAHKYSLHFDLILFEVQLHELVS